MLEKLADSHPDPSVQEMAADIRIAIATHGMVLSDLLKAERSKKHKDSKTLAADKEVTTEQRRKKKKKKSLNIRYKEYKDDEEDEEEIIIPKMSSLSTLESSKDKGKKKVLIEELPDLSASTRDVGSRGEECDTSGVSSRMSSRSASVSPSAATAATAPADTTRRKASSGVEDSGLEEGATSVLSEILDSVIDPPKSPLQQAFTELLDPLIPVRGHGLITLRRLVDQGDEEAVENQQKIVDIFRENLTHTDSYIYLAAIQGLDVMANKYPDKLIPTLVQVQ